MFTPVCPLLVLGLGFALGLEYPLIVLALSVALNSVCFLLVLVSGLTVTEVILLLVLGTLRGSVTATLCVLLPLVLDFLLL